MTATFRLPSKQHSEFLAQAAQQYGESLGRAADYLNKRGISLDAALDWSIGYVDTPLRGHERMHNRLAIPFFTADGSCWNIKFRCIEHDDCKAAGCVKYLEAQDADAHMYMVSNLQVDSPVVGICEGELDALVATTVVGVPSVGVPGAQRFKPWWHYAFEGYREVLIFADGDDAGRSMADKLRGKLSNARVVRMPDGEDLASMVLKIGVDAFKHRAGLDTSII